VALKTLFGAQALSGGSLAGAAPPPTQFARALPADIRAYSLDDIKRLIGFVVDAAVSQHAFAVGDVLDRNTTVARLKS
jgi:hypothetical protein